ncbi:N-glycosylase/DNA lyase [Sulfolobus acidocaldarius]|uniref:N-glycosylase/DNA lyase n=1 Tax=Sulfolobus acidocaldarius TaxID=2285 RepID=UPI000781AAAB|nr:N-glycosylase/DNA lyase [Sulfolobus acidocaldarius]
MLRSLVLNEKLRARVLERAEEFLLNNKADEEVWFRELVLCILTSNSSFISAYKSMNYILDKILYMDEKEISILLQESGYRFYNLKAKYLYRAKNLYGKVKKTIKEIADKDQMQAREFIATHIYSIGYKEASHFLRNVGYLDLAIIDRHILRFINNLGIPIKLKSKREYLLAESLLRSIANNLNVQVGLLDLFIFFKQTNTIVK